jgi:hypothetical protein
MAEELQECDECHERDASVAFLFYVDNKNTDVCLCDNCVSDIGNCAFCNKAFKVDDLVQRGKSLRAAIVKKYHDTRDPDIDNDCFVHMACSVECAGCKRVMRPVDDFDPQSAFTDACTSPSSEVRACSSCEVACGSCARDITLAPSAHRGLCERCLPLLSDAPVSGARANKKLYCALGHMCLDWNSHLLLESIELTPEHVRKMTACFHSRCWLRINSRRWKLKRSELLALHPVPDNTKDSAPKRQKADTDKEP